MHEVKIILNVLTPLYMFGADQRYPELRSSEFRGMTRFWWRALRCCENPIELKSREEEIFGGVSDKSGKSKVSISISNHRDLNTFNSLKDEYHLQYKFNKEKGILEGPERGIAYMLYSVIGKSAFKPNGTFSLILYSKEEQAVRNAIAALWCAINLGGFGARARRGAGSLCANDISGNTYGLDFAPKCRNSQELAQWIIENIRKAADIVKMVDNPCRAYSNLSTSSFVISRQSYNSWREALSAIGNVYIDFRHGREGDIQSAVFGFPIVHRSSGGTVMASIEKGNEKTKIGRRTSPLAFKIIKCGDKYYWMALRFAGDFLPSGAKLAWYKKRRVNGEDREEIFREKRPSYILLDEFWNKIKNDNGGDYSFDLRGDAL